MTRSTIRNTRRVSLSNVAVREKLSYASTYSRALRGDFGPVVREDGRLFVLQPEDPETPDSPHNGNA